MTGKDLIKYIQENHLENYSFKTEVNEGRSEYWLEDFNENQLNVNSKEHVIIIP